jgi:dUTP pyrophosphatase
MTLQFKRFDLTLPAPERKTAGAVGYDLVARIDTEIPPRTVGYVPLNVALQLPPNTWALIAARSSLHKKGLLLANGIGVGDRDFSGDTDEYMAALLNFSDQPVKIEKGERLVQLVIVGQVDIELKEVAKLAQPNRGGFGTTGQF